MPKLALRLAAGLVTLLATSGALAQVAQPWLSNRLNTSGIGIRTGDLELHFGASADTGYDSNFFQGAGEGDGSAEDADVDEPVVPTLRLRVSPFFSLTTLSPQRRGAIDGRPAPSSVSRIAFSTRAALRYSTMWALDSSAGDSVTDAVDGRQLLGGELVTNLNILPQRPLGADLTLGFNRTVQPNNDPGQLQNAFDRNNIAGRLDVRWQPGGGVLAWRFGYRGNLTLYDEEAFGLNRVSHGAVVDGRWLFLPRTALLFEASAGWITHLQDDTRQVDSFPISSLLGVNGLVSPRLGVLVMGGWKAFFFDSGEDFDGLVGRAELSWYLGGKAPLPAVTGGQTKATGLSSIRIGYQRDASNSGLGNFYEVNRVYGDVSAFLGGFLRLGLNGGVGFVNHPTPLDGQGQELSLGGGSLNEVRPFVRFSGEYRVSDVFAIIGNAGWNASLSDNYIILEPGDDGDDLPRALDNLRFNQFSAFVGVRAAL